MDYYIGLGGIGCRTLNRFQEQSGLPASQFYYIDIDPFTDSDLHNSNFYLIRGTRYGTGAYRSIGKNVAKYEILSQRMDSFFSSVKAYDNLSLTFVTTSFGGFGGAVVTEFVEYLEAKHWDLFCQSRGKCRVIAFNESFMETFSIPKTIIEFSKTNTIEFVNEFIGKESIPQQYLRTSSITIFNPTCEMYLINTSGIKQEDFSKYLSYSDIQLCELNISKQYIVKPVKESPEVFLSYSSLDQQIADLVVDNLKQNGIDCWIATKNIKEGSYAKQIMQGIRNAKIFIVLISKNSIASEQVKNEIDRAFNRIKDGLKIIPFIIDDAKLDDECCYYLCRQEMFNATEPPMDKRIKELVKMIKEIIE